MPRWKNLSGVARAEPQRALRVGQRLRAVAVPRERPGQHVVAVDRRPLALPSARASVECVPQPDRRGRRRRARSRGRCWTPFAREQPLDRADQRVLPARGALVAGDAVEVAERGDVLRQRDRVGGALLERESRGADAPRAASHLREPVEARRRSPGTASAVAELALGRADPAVRPEELAELDVRPGGGSAVPPPASTARRIASSARRSTLPISSRAYETRAYEEQARLEGRHPCRRLRRPPGSGRARRARRRSRRSPRRSTATAAAPVARGRAPRESGDGRAPASRARPSRRDRPGRAQCAAQHAIGLRVVGRVAGLARALLVGEAEQPKADDIRGVRTHLLLQLREQCASGRRDTRRNRHFRGHSSRAVGQHAAEQEGGGGQPRRQPSQDQPLCPHYGFCRPFVFSNPLNGSAWYGNDARYGTSSY